MAETKEMTAVEAVRSAVTKLEPEFKAALPAHIKSDKFVRVVLTAVNGDPALLEADRRTLYGAAMKAAQDGLLPDGREAALLVFNKNVAPNGQQPKWEKHVQYMPMVAGVMKKMRNSGEVASITAHVVYEKDEFEYLLGDEEAITHKVPPLGSERGKPIGAYAIATLKDGVKLREVMSFAEIEAVRAVSKAANAGPWTKWWGEQAKKTVIRRMAKRAPSSTDIDWSNADEEFEMDKVPEKTPTPEDQPPAPPRRTRMGAIVDAQLADDVPAAPPATPAKPAAEAPAAPAAAEEVPI